MSMCPHRLFFGLVMTLCRHATCNAFALDVWAKTQGSFGWIDWLCGVLFLLLFFTSSILVLLCVCERPFTNPILAPLIIFCLLPPHPTSDILFCQVVPFEFLLFSSEWPVQKWRKRYHDELRQWELGLANGERPWDH
ncbi:hypothetical protein B0T25DRAFT_69573 [Lasiosphaeria hispida]|uniref:Uncharacterized protein n=1 Tax=Lasiosphaeria hispida TaxID=260671 RepID=A0AAJ0HX90_9PEZI|nr:hypothetical protein B0T25DRAFT_69573 [Lasiosphaeria hispida]